MIRVSIDQILGSPEFLPHAIDPAARAIVFRPTTEQQLREAAFIDGRSDIWAGLPFSIPFSAIPPTEPARPGRYIFHMSFCGSTLLARLLDRPGMVLALKEPNCLVGLADWKMAGAGKDFGPVLQFSRAMLQRPWAEGEAVVIKPSSWANNLLDELATDATAAFVTIPRREFVRAVLRGGSPRLVFTGRLAAHLAARVADGPAALHSAVVSTDKPLDNVARLALVAHQLQLEAFARAGATTNRLIAFEEIETAPLDAASKAARLLGLSANDLGDNVRRWTKANAKADAPFSADVRKAEDEEVERHHAAVIEGALAWADDEFGPPPLIA